MAKIHGKLTRVMVDNAAGVPVDLSVWLDTIDFGPRTADTGETTGFGQNAKTYVAGQLDGTVTMSGKYDAAAGGPDAILRPLLGGNAGTVEYNAEGAGVGKPFQRVEAILTSYNVTAPLGGVVAFSATFQMTGDVTTGAL